MASFNMTTLHPSGEGEIIALPTLPSQVPARSQSRSERRLSQPERRRPSFVNINIEDEHAVKFKLPDPTQLHQHPEHPVFEDAAMASSNPHTFGPGSVPPSAANSVSNLVLDEDPRETGVLVSKRGAAIVGITMTAQLMDLVL